MLYILSVTKCHYIFPLHSLHQLPCTHWSFLPSMFPARWKASYLAIVFFVLYTLNPILCIAISWIFLKSKYDCAIHHLKNLKEIPVISNNEVNCDFFFPLFLSLLLLYNIVYLQFQTLLKIFNLCFLVFDINFVPVFLYNFCDIVFVGLFVFSLYFSSSFFLF